MRGVATHAALAENVAASIGGIRYTTCESAIALLRCAAQTLTGTTAHARDDYDPGPGGCTGRPETGRDVVYRIDLQPADTLEALYRQTEADGAMYLVTDCGNPAGACVAGADQDPSGGYESITYVASAAATYYLVLDSFGDDTGGPWMLQYHVGCAGPASGACTTPDCWCQNLTLAECTALGGRWAGAGTLCDAPGEPAHVLTPDTGGPRLLYAPGGDDDLQYRAAIAARAGGTCDYYDARFGTPSIELLDGYDCVMTVGGGYLDSLGFGNNLADFVDHGGHVVLGMFCAYTSGPWHLGGRIMVLGSPKQRDLAPGMSKAQGMKFAAEVLQAASPYDCGAARCSERKCVQQLLRGEAGSFLDGAIERVDSQTALGAQHPARAPAPYCSRPRQQYRMVLHAGGGSWLQRRRGGPG